MRYPLFAGIFENIEGRGSIYIKLASRWLLGAAGAFLPISTYFSQGRAVIAMNCEQGARLLGRRCWWLPDAERRMQDILAPREHQRLARGQLPCSSPSTDLRGATEAPVGRIPDIRVLTH